jgi:hypothetical protein
MNAASLFECAPAAGGGDGANGKGHTPEHSLGKQTVPACSPLIAYRYAAMTMAQTEPIWLCRSLRAADDTK